MSRRFVTGISIVGMMLVAGCGPSRPAGETEQVETRDPATQPARPTMMRIDRIDVENGGGVFVARRDAGDTRIPFPLPINRLSPEKGHDMEQVGETPDGVVVVLDRYASRTDGSRCADGHETFLRAFSIGKRKQAFERQVESCLEGMKAMPVQWVGDNGFRIGEAAFTVEGGERVIAENAHG